ncbi:MAG: hypothetical protein AAF217_12530 [Pseudomonadota bacterium]
MRLKLLPLIYIIICGLIVGAFTHIIIVLLIPKFGANDPATQIMQRYPVNVFRELDDVTDVKLSNVDPFMRIAICRYNLGETGIFVKAPLSEPFWSASVFNASGQVIYSFNQRTAIGQQLQMLLVNPVQKARIRQLEPETFDRIIQVEVSEAVGFVVVRTLLRDESLAKQVSDFLKALECLPHQLN